MKENEEKDPNDDDPESMKKSEEKDTIIDNRKQKRLRQREKKNQENKLFPKLSQKILFKEFGCDEWRQACVKQTFKKTSKYKNVRHLEIENGGLIERDFVNDIEDWKVVEETSVEEPTETYFMSDILGMKDENCVEAFPVKILPRNEYKRPEIQEAMKAEISKFESFKAFKEIEDNGQYSVPIRWVVTEQKLDGKNQPYKARLCIRGDREQGKEHIRSDSPTASKETLKIALIIAANEGFEVKSGDIKSAFLQGAKLDREILVKPPPEANKNGKLWQLLHGAYGILDGGRLFYLKLS